jgi:hypothetical protein
MYNTRSLSWYFIFTYVFRNIIQYMIVLAKDKDILHSPQFLYNIFRKLRNMLDVHTPHHIMVHYNIATPRSKHHHIFIYFIQEKIIRVRPQEYSKVLRFHSSSFNKTSRHK